MREWIEVKIEAKSPAIQDGYLVEGVGVETVGQVLTPLLNRGATVPTSVEQTFSTAEDNQTGITIHVLRGSARLASDCHSLARIEVSGILPEPRGVPQLRLALIVRDNDLFLSVRLEREWRLSINDQIIQTRPEAITPRPKETHSTDIHPRRIEQSGQMKCPVCGRTISSDHTRPDLVLDYCPHCATPLSDLRGRNARSGLHQVDADELHQALEELDELVGLNRVKGEIRQLIDFISVQNRRQRLGKRVPELSNHLVFVGNPGTGKTTVARLMGRIYFALGVCRNPTVIETDRAGLVAQYVGQTAIKTKEVISAALGGILFIDEAYTLTPKTAHGNDFGQEAVESLIKEMEDQRGDLVVIVAGYPDEMHRFVSSNPGLESRFSRHIHFEDYSPEEMTQIFCDLCTRNEYHLQPGAARIVREHFDSLSANKSKGFANGRSVRNLFETVLRVHSSRVGRNLDTATDIELVTISSEDVKLSVMQ